MKLPACVACGGAVLELQGQHAFLHSYLTIDGAPPPITAGSWHATCLATAAVGLGWHAALVQSYVSVRGFVRLAETPGFTVAQQPGGARSVIALGRAGFALPLTLSRTAIAGARPAAGGTAFPLSLAEYNFDADPGLIGELQSQLRATGRYRLTTLAERLGILARLAHLEVLADAAFRYVPELAELWTPSAISAAVDYSLFVPDELTRFVIA